MSAACLKKDQEANRNFQDKKIMTKIAEVLAEENLISPTEKARLLACIRRGDAP